MAQQPPSLSWSRQVQVVSATTVTVEQRSPDPRRHSHWKSAVVIFVVVVAVHALLDRLPFGENIRDFEYATLRRALLIAFVTTTPLQGDDPLSPVVVDISDIPFDRLKPTDRRMLGTLVRDLEASGAAAIGIDIDFSPENEGLVSADDQKLFLEWRHAGNVRVGVFRRAGNSSSEWLGHPLFQQLAAGIMLPADDAMFAYAYSSPMALPEGRRRDAAWQDEYPQEYLRQMPAALYDVRHRDERPSLLNNSRIETQTVVNGRLSLGRYPIDYSYLKSIRRILYHTNASLKPYEEWIAGKTILIGDTRDAQDSRSISGEKEPIPGVMIHAAAFATLNHGLLWYPGRWASLVLEVLALGLAVGVMSFAGSRKAFRGLSDEALEILCFSCAAIAVFVVGTSLVGVTKLFWPDFAWTSVLLFVHPYLTLVWDRLPALERA